MRQQQQRQSTTRPKVASNPVKPEVADVFETDAHMMESMRSEQERGSFNLMVAAEKVSSPSIIRNKHIKTMTQLMKGTITPSSMSSGLELQQPPQQYQRLFKQSMESPRMSVQAPKPLATEQSITRNVMVYKTMSSVNLDGKHSHPATTTIESQIDDVPNIEPATLMQTNSCRILRTRGQIREASDNQICLNPVENESETLAQHIRSNRRKNQFALAQSTPGARESKPELKKVDQQVIKSQQTSAIKSGILSQLKKNRNNSTSDVSRKLFQSYKLQLQPTSGNVTCRPVKLSSGNDIAVVVSGVISPTTAVATNNSNGKLTVKSNLELAGQSGQTKVLSASVKAGSSAQNNFSTAANCALNSKKHANFELTQNLVLHQDLSSKRQASLHQSENQLKEKQTSSTGPNSQKLFQFLKRKEQSVEGPMQAATQVTAVRVPNTRSSIFIKNSNRTETTTSKEAISLSQNLCITAVHQPKHSLTKQVLEKRTTAAVQIPLLSLTALIQSPAATEQVPHLTARVSHNLSSQHVISRNPKQVYASQSRPAQALPNESQSVNRLQANSVYASLTVPRLSARSHGFGGAKKEIKCVVTKQTKFGEERQQQLQHQQQHANLNKRTSPLQASHEQGYELFNNALTGPIRAEKKTAATKKLDLQCSTKAMSKTASQIAVQKSVKSFSYVNTSTNGKTSRPNQPMIMPTAQTRKKYNKKKETDQIAKKKDYHTATQKAPNSADKNKEKLKRRQITDKIKSQLQLIQAFEQHREIDRIRQEMINGKAKPSMSEQKLEIAQISNKNASSSLRKTFDDKVQSPVMKVPSKFMTKTPSKEPNPHRPQQKANRQHNNIFKSSTDNALLSSQHKQVKSEKNKNKNKRQPDSSQVYEIPKLDLDQQFNQIKSEEAKGKIDTKFESPRFNNDSQYESQLSAPQEMSSCSSSTSLGLGEKTSKSVSKGVIVPQSVAKSTKQKLSKLELLSLTAQAKKANALEQRSFFGYQTRNFDNNEIRFSQRMQRTLPNLIVPHETLLPLSATSQLGVDQESATIHRNHESPGSTGKHQFNNKNDQADLSEALATIKDKATLHNKRSTYIPGRNKNRNDALMHSERRNTVYSDQLSIDLARQSKPTFLKPEKKKGPRLNIKESSKVTYSLDSESKQNISGSSFSRKMSKSRKNGAPCVGSAEQGLHTFESSKNIPPFGFYEEIQQKNKKLCIKKKKSMEIKDCMATEMGIRGHKKTYGSGLNFAEQKNKERENMKRGNQSSSGDQYTDWNAIDNVQSPPKSIADEVCQQSAFKTKLFDELVQLSASAKYSKHGFSSSDDCGTNDAFSDSQFGEIPDEENYKLGVRERDMNSFKQAGDATVVAFPLQGRPTANLSGKYTSCTNKNDALQKFDSTQKRLPTMRQVGSMSQVECSNFNAVETVKQILSKKGSKCKCLSNEAENQQQQFYTGTTRTVCGNFCKHLSGRQQKKIIKKLLLENFKMIIENVLKSNQRLALGQKQNPFMLGANFGCLGDRKFFISASWWSKWCDYVNFNVDEHGLTFPKESFRDELLCDTNEEFNDFMDLNIEYQGVEVADMELEDRQNQVDKILRLSIYQQSSFATLAEAIENDNEQSQLFYERPEMIENNNLLEKDEMSYRNQIKKTLVEHFDFEVVPHSVWQHLYSWYSADVTICRKLAIDTMANKSTSGQQGMPTMGSSQPLAVHAQDSQRNSKFRVFLDLWPQQNQPIFGATGMTTQSVINSEVVQNQHRFAGLVQEYLSDQDEPASNDTTQLLYQQNIEDYSSTANQTSVFVTTPEQQQHQATDQYMRKTPKYNGQVPQNRGKSCSVKDEEPMAVSLFQVAQFSNAQRSRQPHQFDSGFPKTSAPQDGKTIGHHQKVADPYRDQKRMQHPLQEEKAEQKGC